MERPAKLGGWWRLWIVLSAFWIVAVLVAGYALFPRDGMALHSVEFVNALPERFRDRLSLDGTSSVGTAAEFPNGYVMKFRPGTSEEEMTEVAREYAKVSGQSQSNQRRAFLLATTAAATVPIALVAFVGLSIAWVRRGFIGGGEA